MQDGRYYTANSAIKAKSVVSNGQFGIAVAGLVHGHVFGIINGLCEAGANVVSVWDYESSRIEDFIARFPGCRRAETPEELISSPDVKLVVNCMMPDVRADYSVKCLAAGKAVFSDKPGFLSVEDGVALRNAVRNYNGRYCIYFSEHFHSEGTILAQKLIEDGRIGHVFSYIGMGPHRLNESTRPDWFFKPEINGNVITDLGCHLIEQFLLYTGNCDAEILSSRKANVAYSQYPAFFDTGEVILKGSNGASGYINVNWFTPDGLSSWGDCRAFIYGDKGEIEVRKYCDLCLSDESDHVYIADDKGVEVIHAHNTLGFDFFGSYILDCLKPEKPCSLHVNGLSLPLFCIRAMELSVLAGLR